MKIISAVRRFIMYHIECLKYKRYYGKTTFGKSTNIPSPSQIQEQYKNVLVPEDAYEFNYPEDRV